VKLLIGLLACVVIVYFSALKWRRAVKAVFILLVIEGALRKWVLPQASEMIYFLKDIVLFGAYFSFYCFPVIDKKYLPNSKYQYFNFCRYWWCVFQVFNPSLGSPLVGLFDLEDFFDFPYIWMVPALFQSRTKLLLQVFAIAPLLTIPVGLSVLHSSLVLLQALLMHILMRAKGR
jgi:hypothetical protein